MFRQRWFARSRRKPSETVALWSRKSKKSSKPGSAIGLLLSLKSSERGHLRSAVQRQRKSRLGFAQGAGEGGRRHERHCVLLLGTELFREECERFWREVEDPIAPASWEAELANVLWMATRKQVLDLPGALHRLQLAKSLGIRSISISNLWHGALVRAHAFGVAAYDTLFIELAEREAIPLATFDEPVIKAFPRLAMRPRRVPAQ